MGTKQDLLKGGLSAYSTLFFTLTGNFFFQVLLMRFLAPEQAGIYFVFLSVIYLVSMVTSGGIVASLAYFLPKTKGKEKSQYFSTAWISLTLANGLLFVAIALTVPIEGIPQVLVFFTGLSILLQSFFSNVPHYVKLFKLRTSLAFSTSFIKLGIVLITFWMGIFDLFYVFAAILISNIFLFVSTLFFMGRAIPFALPTFSKLKKLIVFGFPFLINNTANTMQGWLSTLFLTMFGGVVSVADFNSVMMLVRNVFFVLVPQIGFSALPTLVVFEGDKKKELTRWIFKFAIFALLFFSAIFLLFAEDILRILYPAYLAQANLMRLAVFFLFPIPLSRFIAHIINSHGNSHILLRPSIIFILLSVILNLALVSQWEILGAVVATGLSSLIFTAMLLIEFKTTLPRLKWVATYVLAFAAVTAFCFFLFGFNWTQSFLGFAEDTLLNTIVILGVKSAFFALLSLLVVGRSMPREDRDLSRKLFLQLHAKILSK